MQVIDLLNQMDAAGTLRQLYQAGVVNLKAYSQRDVVLTYRALLAGPAYADQPTKAAKATASTCYISVRSVYRALREMEKAV